MISLTSLGGAGTVTGSKHLLEADGQRLLADVCEVATYVRDIEASKAVTSNTMPKAILAASGMATGGRVLHHIKAYGPDRRNTILFSGFQAAGTRGRAMVEGAKEVKIHGQWIPIADALRDEGAVG